MQHSKCLDYFNERSGKVQQLNRLKRQPAYKCLIMPSINRNRASNLPQAGSGGGGESWGDRLQGGTAGPGRQREGQHLTSKEGGAGNKPSPPGLLHASDAHAEHSTGCGRCRSRGTAGRDLAQPREVGGCPCLTAAPREPQEVGMGGGNGGAKQGVGEWGGRAWKGWPGRRRQHHRYATPFPVLSLLPGSLGLVPAKQLSGPIRLSPGQRSGCPRTCSLELASGMPQVPRWHGSIRWEMVVGWGCPVACSQLWTGWSAMRAALSPSVYCGPFPR